MSNFYVTLSFWPVGQGLFSSGHIKIDERAKPQYNDFHWIYDCSSTKKDHFYKAIGLYNESNQNGDIDLVVISHFDKDSIQGLNEILSTKKIHYLLLPFLPLWQRLIIAIDAKLNLTKAEDNNFFNFLIDPVGYLANHYGMGGTKAKNAIEEIVFVLSEQTDFEYKKVDDDALLEDDNKDEEILQFDRENVKHPDFMSKNIKTTVLKFATSMIFDRIWEFMPYNDASFMTNVSDDFIKNIENLIEKYKKQPKNKNALLEHLKEKYINTFKKINFTQKSLFLYSGPVNKSKNYHVNYKVDYANYKSLRKISSYIVPNDLGNEFLWNCFSLLCFEPKIGKSAILYTGDGVLNTIDKYNRMQKHFSADRMNKVAIFQVMNHGSRYNWYLGLADKIAPKWSIFSANPKIGEHHPHSEVLHDFIAYQPTLVDNHKGAYFVISTW